MSKQRFYRASVASSGLGVVFTLAWGATGVQWTFWALCVCLGAAAGSLVGGYIEPKEE